MEFNGLFSSKLLNIKFKCFHVNIKLYVYSSITNSQVPTQFFKENVAYFLKQFFLQGRTNLPINDISVSSFLTCLLVIPFFKREREFCLLSLPRMAHGDGKEDYGRFGGWALSFVGGRSGSALTWCLLGHN